MLLIFRKDIKMFVFFDSLIIYNNWYTETDTYK